MTKMEHVGWEPEISDSTDTQTGSPCQITKTFLLPWFTAVRTGKGQLKVKCKVFDAGHER